MINTLENTDDRIIIPFILGEETRPKIEQFGNNDYSINIKNSIFYNQYCTALSSIAESIVYNKYYKTEYPHSNLFIFTGERGSGKTSCMSTVKELLCNRHYKQICYKDITLASEKGIDLEEILSHTDFHSIETIDPILFDNQHNILDMILGNLFKSFQDYENNNHQNTLGGDISRDELLSHFNEAKKNLSILNKEKSISDFDNLEQLCDLAASLNFKKSLNNVVTAYINYIYGKGHQLVLCIDDIDLNMSEGYEMIEQIRKYLNIPGLIILMSIKVEQLANVIRIKYYKDFSPLLKLKKENAERQKGYNEIINEIVQKYISKLIPLTHRIQLPTIASLLNHNVDIFRYDNSLNASPTKIETLESLKDGLPRLIYRKTRQLIYNTTREINYIIPRNLRELLNLIHLLCNMEDVHNHKEAMPNLIRYKEYFQNVWCTNNLEEEKLACMHNLFNIINADVVNQMVISFLKKEFPVLGNLKEKTGEKDNSIKELENIIDDENIVYNISLGDVLACLDWLYKICEKEQDLKFLFAIKTFYSIFLYEKFRSNDEIKEEEEKKKKKEIINRAPLTNNATSYGDILNGNFFNSEYLNVAPYEGGNISRCRRIINNEYLQELIEFVKGEKERLSFYEKTDSIDKNIVRKIVDFFIFTTSFVVTSKDKSPAIYNYRKEQDIYYDKKIMPTRKYICFDVLSIFYNLLDIKKAYSRYPILIEGKKCTLDPLQIEKIQKRIEEKYEDEAKREELIRRIKRGETNETRLLSITRNSPLYADILKKVDVQEDPSNPIPNYKKEKVLLYRLNLRNIELLEQISYHLQRKRPDGSSDSVKVIKDMFSNLSEYKIKTYNNHDINFVFFKAISDFLDELNKKEKENEKEIFNKIFSNA